MLKDARDYQILFLSLFLFLGIGTRDWTLRWDLMVSTITVCLLTQWFLAAVVNYSKAQQEWNFQPLNLQLFSRTTLSGLRSAMITGLSLCLLLRANDQSTMAVAACLAIASKFIFRYQGKHFFNPANFGIIAALILTQDAWVSPGQWGADWWYLLLFTCTGGMLLKRVGRGDTSAAFLFAYGGMMALRNSWLGWTWDVWYHQLMNGSLLLFAFFMLTDPRSIPNARVGRLIWAISIAVVAFVLQEQFYLSTAIFWALFAVAPLTVVLDYIWSAPWFSWSSTANAR